MNRRVLMAGVAAMAGTGTVTAQEATPGGGKTTAEDRLRYLLFDVVEGGDYTGLAGMVANDIDVNTLIEGMAEAHQFAESGLSLNMLCSDGNQAIAYATISSESNSDYSLFIHIAVDDAGLIRSYRWMARYND